MLRNIQCLRKLTDRFASCLNLVAEQLKIAVEINTGIRKSPSSSKFPFVIFVLVLKPIGSGPLSRTVLFKFLEPFGLPHGLGIGCGGVLKFSGELCSSASCCACFDVPG